MPSRRLPTAVEVGAGNALVFGRVRVTTAEHGREFLVFSTDPMEHVIPTIVRLIVKGDTEKAFTLLRARYPPVPEPKATVPMVPEPP